MAARVINNWTPGLTGAPVVAQGRGAAGGGLAVVLDLDKIPPAVAALGVRHEP